MVQNCAWGYCIILLWACRVNHELSLFVARSRVKLENTTLSTGCSKAPVYDIVYIAQQSFRNEMLHKHLEY